MCVCAPVVACLRNVTKVKTSIRIQSAAGHAGYVVCPSRCRCRCCPCVVVLVVAPQVSSRVKPIKRHTHTPPHTRTHSRYASVCLARYTAQRILQGAIYCAAFKSMQQKREWTQKNSVYGMWDECEWSVCGSAGVAWHRLDFCPSHCNWKIFALAAAAAQRDRNALAIKLPLTPGTHFAECMCICYSKRSL